MAQWLSHQLKGWKVLGSHHGTGCSSEHVSKGPVHHLVDISTGISINNQNNSCSADIFIDTGAKRYDTDLSKLVD